VIKPARINSLASVKPQTMEPGDYSAIVCRAPDRLRIVNAYDDIIEVVRSALEMFQVPFTFYYKSKATCAFKMQGSPFMAQGCNQDTTIEIKRVVACALKKLQEISWHVVTNTDIGKLSTNSCIFLRRILVTDQITKNKLSRDGNIFTFSPSGISNILLIDVPHQIEKDLVDAVSVLCSVKDYKLLENVDGVIITSRINLSGFTWGATGDSAIAVRRMILEVIRTARRHKYDLVTNLNLKGTTDSLMFQHKMSLSDSAEDMFAMSLNRNDRLRLLCAPSYVVTSTEELVTDNWGVQGCKEKAGDCSEFKLYGTPWWADGETAVKSRFLIAVIIAKFKSLGWEVAATVDVSRKLNDKTVFIFRQCPPETQEWAVLSFHESDKMRFLSSTDTFMLTDGIDRILDAADATKTISYYWKAKQWTLRGVPFSGHSTYGVDQRLIIHLLSRIMKHFHKQGWRLVASADISAKYHSGNNNSYPLDTHSWFLLHDPDSMIVSEAVINMDIDCEGCAGHDDEFENQIAVDEIKSERSKLRYFTRVVLPAAFIVFLILYYVYSIVL